MSAQRRPARRPPPRPRPTAEPAGPRGVRDLALAALARVDEGGWANLAVPTLLERSNLEPRDRAAVTDLVYGTVRLRSALDYALAPHSRRPLDTLDPAVLRGLRLGAYELLFAGTPPHAAVAEVVAATKRAGHEGQSGYVNAVLRKLAASSPAWPDPAADPIGWATSYGAHPKWVAREAFGRLGAEGLRRLVEADNERPVVTLRATPGRATRDELLSELSDAGFEVAPTRLSPEGIALVGGGEPGALAAIRDGRAVVQDEGSALVAPALGIQPGDLVADLTAGPGGKAGHLAALGARVLAVELHPARARMVAETAARLAGLPGTARPSGSAARQGSGRNGAPSGRDREPSGGGEAPRLLAVVGDGTRPPIAPGTLDGALVDAPCTNLGSLRRRPEARWRHGPDEIPRLTELQYRLLAAATLATRPGGTVLYSVCTWSREETEGVVTRALGSLPLTPAPLAGPLGDGTATSRQLWPHRDGTDGIFLARFTRTG
jgi:16S rRNA (cytosine967-C5)-methyltransferase